MKKATKNQLSISMVGVLTVYLFMHFASAVRAAPTPISHLNRLLTHFTTYQADFSQQTYDRSGNLLQSSEGKVTLERPGKFRWDITKPNVQTIIANNDVLWIYDQDLAQATRQQMQAKRPLDIANLLTQSISTLSENFMVKTQQCGMSHCFHLIPKNRESGFNWVDLRFDRKKLARIGFEKEAGRHDVFYFTHVKLNVTLNSSIFSFTPTKGVDILKN